MANEIPICDNPEVLQERTIVILGETGVGKSTFVNNTTLMIRFKTLNDAISNAKAFTPPIPVRGTFKGVDISDGSDSNEGNERASSRTKSPIVYKIQSGTCVFNIFDTPGMADSGGIEMDKLHAEQITACLRNFKRIHAILILVNSSNNRLTKSLKSTLNELLSCLGITTASLISFIVTRVTYTKEMSDASDVIIKYVNHLKDITGFNVEPSNMFGFEAFPFKYFMASKKGLIEEVSWEKSLNSMVYQTNREELLRLFKKINNCSVQYDMMNARTLILAKQLEPKLSTFLTYLSQFDIKSSKDLDELNCRLQHWREEQTSLELDKCKEELEQANNWPDKISNYLCKVITFTASGMASVAGTGTAVGASAGVNVLSPETALFTGIIEGTVGLTSGASLEAMSNSETVDPEVDKLIEIYRREVARIEEKKREKKTEYDEFITEQRMLCNLLQDITSYLQENAIVMVNNVDALSQQNKPIEINDTNTNKTDVNSKKTVSNMRAKCKHLSPEILYGRLNAMTSLKYFGSNIKEVLRECENLEVFGVKEFRIFLEPENDFFQEIMGPVI